MIDIDEQSIVYSLTIGGIAITTLLWLSSREKKLRPYINDVKALDDGTISIDWGYHNHADDELSFEKGESCLHVKKGRALLLAEHPPAKFAKGKHDKVFRTIVVKGTVIEWIIGDTRLQYSVSG